MPRKPNTSACDVYLIGPPAEEIHCSRLPTNQQVLQLLFYRIKSSRSTIREKATLVAKEVQEIWNKTEIPTSSLRNVVERIMNLHDEWVNVTKNKYRKASIAQRDKEQKFKEKISNLFDISNSTSTELLKSPERIFLKGQQSVRRRGFISFDNHNESNELLTYRIPDEELSDLHDPGEHGKYTRYYIHYSVD